MNASSGRTSKVKGPWLEAARRALARAMLSFTAPRVGLNWRVAIFMIEYWRWSVSGRCSVTWDVLLIEVVLRGSCGHDDDWSGKKGRWMGTILRDEEGTTSAYKVVVALQMKPSC